MSPPVFGQARRATDVPDASTEERAKELVNPTSGLANDYLNIFNELVMLVEQLPEVPEFAEDVLNWRPRTYQDYFTNSNLPGRESALSAYAQLDLTFRKEFEQVVADLDRIATGCVAVLRRLLKKGDEGQGAMASQCEKTSSSMRELLLRASNLIDHGSSVAADNAQRRADRLFAVRQQAIRDVEDFYNRPRFAPD